MYVVTGPVRYGQIDVRVRARSARGVRDLDIIWTHFGGVDTSVYQGGQYTGNLPPPPLFGVDGHKYISARTCNFPIGTGAPAGQARWR